MKTPLKALVLCLATASIGLAQQGAPQPAASEAAKAQVSQASASAAQAGMVAPAPIEVKPTFTDAQLLEEFGWLVGKRTGLAEWGFKPDEAATITKGVLAALNGQESPYEIQKVGPAMDEFIQKKQTTLLQAMKEKNMAEATGFFAKLKDDKTVVELPDGLRYTIVAPGTGTPPVPTDTVKVNYTGKLINGTVFDTSERAGKPAEFELSKVIAGWTEGLQKISKGGKIKLYVPPQLAYGDDGRPGIPPGSVLIFDIDLLDVTPAPMIVVPGK